MGGWGGAIISIDDDIDDDDDDDFGTMQCNVSVMMMVVGLILLHLNGRLGRRRGRATQLEAIRTN